LIQENADPAVLRDLERWLSDLAPESRPWEHDDEGPDDMPAHAKAAVTRVSETIPVSDGELAFGTWQALYVWEHRARPHTRRLVVHVFGE
jgi:secondary thiamine-phosphate synthase enzyme